MSQHTSLLATVPGLCEQPVAVLPCQVARWEHPGFEQLQARPLPMSESSPLPKGCVRGASVWQWRSRYGLAYIAFEWIRLRGSVMSLFDPTDIQSNIRFLDPVGQAMPDDLALLELNGLVYDLAWQDQALKACRLHQHELSQASAVVGLRNVETLKRRKTDVAAELAA